LKVCAWINPYIAQRSALFDEGSRNSYLLHDRQGNVWQWDMWQAGMGLVDFTNPDATAWYLGKLKALLDMGVDCFKTDFGERVPVDVCWHDGSDPEKMHNYYTLLYNKAVFGLLERERGVGEAVVFARSATAGSQRFPTHWGGDNTATYPSMAESLRGGLSLSLSGFGFWGHDIESTATPDLYKRWAAFGLLSPYSRLHGSTSYRVPWLFDEEAVDVLRFFTRLKCSLMPYLFSSACETAETGVPMMRPMALEFAGDPAVDALDRQYMFGETLLVAPVFTETGDVSYYLPQGTWTNIITGRRVEGNCWHSETHGYMSLPLLARPNSLLPFGASDTQAAYDYASGAVLHLFELGDGHTAACAVRNSKGAPELQVTVTRQGNAVTVRAAGAGKPWSLILRGVHAVKGAQGAALKDSALGIEVVPEQFTGEFVIEM
jgi:alpha-D-xyloside xylohydrolase